MSRGGQRNDDLYSWYGLVGNTADFDTEGHG